LLSINGIVLDQIQMNDHLKIATLSEIAQEVFPLLNDEQRQHMIYQNKICARYDCDGYPCTVDHQKREHSINDCQNMMIGVFVIWLLLLYIFFY